MVGNVLVVLTGASAELWGAVGSRRLSPTVRILPKPARRLPTPATVCHELPRTASFSRRDWSAAFRRNFDLVNRRVAMLMAGLVLGRIDSLKLLETRSVSRDPWLENDREGTRSPVTVCHINFAGVGVRGSGRRRGDLSVGGFGGAGVPRRTGPRRMWLVRGSMTDWGPISRQFTDRRHQDGDIWRQLATEIGPPNWGGRRGLAE